MFLCHWIMSNLTIPQIASGHHINFWCLTRGVECGSSEINTFFVLKHNFFSLWHIMNARTFQDVLIHILSQKFHPNLANGQSFFCEHGCEWTELVLHLCGCLYFGMPNWRYTKVWIGQCSTCGRNISVKLGP